MKRGIKASLLVLLFALTCLRPCFAFSTEKHMEKIEAVFWGEDGFAVKGKSPEEKRWKLVTSALYLCVDQVNAKAENKRGSDQAELSSLQQAHAVEWLLNGLPTEIHEIDFSWNSGRHQGHTHKGWEADYTEKFGKDWQQKWLLRKRILVSTISYEFHNFEDDKQLDSFCAWLYYLHIFEDLQADVDKHEINTTGSEYQYYQRSSETITLAETIGGLMKYGDGLFQSSSDQWKRLRDDLSDLLDVADKFEITCKTEEEFVLYKECLSEVRETLKGKVPDLIQQEQFFKEAFPKL